MCSLIDIYLPYQNETNINLIFYIMNYIKYLGCFLNPSESQKLSGADVVFKYEHPNKGIITVLACQNGEVWQQWGAEDAILYLNVERVEAWFKYINNHSDNLQNVVS